MEKAVGAVVGMGILYWIAYALAMMLAFSAVALMLLGTLGIVGLVYYLSHIFDAIRRKDSEAAFIVLLAPAVLTGGTFVFYKLAEAGISFGGLLEYVANNVVAIDKFPWSLVLIPFGIFGCVLGWLFPLLAAHEKVSDDPRANKEPTGVVAFKIVSVGMLWAFIAGYYFLGAATGAEFATF